MIVKILITFSIITQSINATRMLMKCCPYGEIVQIDSFEDNLLSPQNVYNCVKPKNVEESFRQKRQDSETIDTIDLFNSNDSFETFIGYNTLVDHLSHWPACGETLSINRLNEPLKGSESASCVDVMDNAYFIFTCDEKIDAASDVVDIYKLRKCCPADMSYDIFGRKCVVNNETNINDNFREFLHDKVVLFEHNLMKCNGDDVLVEYHSHVHDLKSFESTLVITNLNGFGPDVFSRGLYCIDHTMNSDVEQPIGMGIEHFRKRAASKFIAKVCRDKGICNQIPCIRKCCELGERMTFENKSYCEPHNADPEMQFYSFDIQQSRFELQRIEPSEYGIMMPKYCPKFLLEDHDIHYISGIDGSLYYENANRIHPNEEFCVDYFYIKDEEDPENDIRMRTFVCFNDEDHKLQNIQFHTYASLMAISSFFLGITFFVYIFLPKLLNLHGKTVVCHVISLFIGYTCLSLIQFFTDAKLPFCLCIAFVVYFGLLAAFSWLNVMCLDIYWTFGSVRASQGIGRSREMKRFMYYSFYAWGFPFIMTIFTFMINFYDVLPEEYQPNIGKTKCWFEENSSPGHLIFFLFPIGIQITINFILFILTAIHCNRIKAEIHRMQMCDNNDQQKRKSFIADKAIFAMNVKLFCVMGISWLLEIIATLYKQNSMVWYISDVFNCLQGVMVFFIFVFKKKVLVAFQKKLGIRLMGFRPKTPGSTTLSTLDLNSTSVSKHNSRMMKSNSAATLSSNINSTKN